MTKQKKTDSRSTSKKDKPTTQKGKTRTNSDKQGKRRRLQSGTDTTPKELVPKKGIPFWCKTNMIIEINSKIEKFTKGFQVKKYLEEANFHGLLELQVQLIDKELVEGLIDSFNPLRKTFDVGGQSLTLEASDEGRMYGLPTEGRTVNPLSCGAKDFTKMEREINISFVGRARLLKTKKIYATWEYTTDPAAFAKMYIDELQNSDAIK